MSKKFSIPWRIPDLIKRFGKAKEAWELTRSLHQEAYDFSMPDRETFRFHSQGQDKNRHVYDSTAVDGLEVFANKVQGGYFPDWLEWMEFVPGASVRDEDLPKRKKSLEKATKIFFDHFHASNFSTEITPSLKDWGIGTGCIEIEEGSFKAEAQQEILQFTNVPLAEVYPEKPARGAVKSSWREHKVEAINIEQTWPNADIPDSLKETIKNKPMTKVKIYNGHIHNPKDNKYYHVVIYPAKKHLLFAQSFKTKRRIIFRGSVTPGEVFGRGPIIRMIADIRTANKVKQFILQNAALQMAGVYTGVDDGVFNPYTVRIAPGSVIPVTSNNSANPTLRQLERSGDLRIGDIVLADLQSNIRRGLLAEPMGTIDDPVRSATEQVLRHQDDVKRSLTSFGRLFSELVIPLVMACSDILAERETALPKQFTLDGLFTKIRMVSPLAKQQDMEDFQNTQVWWSFVQTLPEPVQLASAKIENLPRYVGEKLSIPTNELVRDKTEVDSFANNIMQAAQAGLLGGGVAIE